MGNGTDEFLQIRKLQQAEVEIASQESDLNLRRKYANGLLVFLFAYFGFVALILVACGLKAWGFELPIGVLYVLVGSTPISAVSVVAVIARGLFAGS